MGAPWAASGVEVLELQGLRVEGLSGFLEFFVGFFGLSSRRISGFRV